MYFYFALHNAGKAIFIVDIYHNNEEKIDWVEFIVDASNYIDTNNPNASLNSTVVKQITEAV